MCESGTSVMDDHVVLGAAVSRVVLALSPQVKQDLLETLVSQMIGDAGDVSTLEQFEAVMAKMGEAPFGYKVDEAAVRSTVCAAASVFSMCIGPGPSPEEVVDLAECALDNRSYDKTIY